MVLKSVVNQDIPVAVFQIIKTVYQVGINWRLYAQPTRGSLLGKKFINPKKRNPERLNIIFTAFS